MSRQEGCHLPRDGWRYLICADSSPAAAGRLLMTAKFTSTGASWAVPEVGPDRASRAAGRSGSEQGNVIQPSTWWPVWQKVRARELTEQQCATPLLRRLYDLRHSGVTWRLNSGVPATEVAAWAGHSVEVLMRVYAKCMTGLEDLWISRMDDALHLENPQQRE